MYVTNRFKINGVMLLMVLLNCFPAVIKSQETEVIASDLIMNNQDSTLHVDSMNQSVNTYNPHDTTYFDIAMDSVVMAEIRQLHSKPVEQPKIVQPFKPNPTRAVLYSAVFPGLGQIYNRKYWKVPIVYGGFVGFTYAITWNNKNLQDCGEAYKDLSYDLINYKDEPENWHQSWQNFVAPGVNPEVRFNENFKTQLKRWRDLYRRNRDFSIIIAAGFYLICMADAYVDAQLFDFDISTDLSLRVEPVVSPATSFSQRLYGFNCSIKF